MAEAEGTSSADAEVAAALGIGEGVDEQEVDEQEVGEDQESENEVEAELARLKTEVATLRREAAERRVREKKQAAKPTGKEGPSDVEAAREAGREEARAEHGVELTEARIRAALTSVIPEDRLDDFVDDLNIARYVGDDHKPDLEAIAALKDRQASLFGAAAKRKTSVQNGRQGSGKGSKSNADQFADVLSGLLK